MSLFHSKNSSNTAPVRTKAFGILPAALLAAAGMMALAPTANAGGSFSVGFSFGGSFSDGCDPCVPSWWSTPSYSSSVVFTTGVSTYDPCGWNSWTPVYRRPVFVSSFVSRPFCGPTFDPCFPSFWTGYSHWHRPYCGPVIVAPVFPVYSCDFVPSYAVPAPCNGFYSSYSSSAYFSRSFVSFGFFFGSSNQWCGSNWRRDCVVVRPVVPVCGPVVHPRGPIGHTANGFVVGQQPVVIGPMPTRIPQQPVVVPPAVKPAAFVSGPSPSVPTKVNPQPNVGKPATQPYIASKPPTPTTSVPVNPVIRESTGKPVAVNGNPGFVPGKTPATVPPVASKPRAEPSRPTGPVGPTKTDIAQPQRDQRFTTQKPEPATAPAPRTAPKAPATQPQVQPKVQPQVQPQAQPTFRSFTAAKPATAPAEQSYNKSAAPSQQTSQPAAPTRQPSPTFVSPKQGQLGQRERTPSAAPSAGPSQRQAPSRSPSPSPAMRSSGGPSPSAPGSGGGFGQTGGQGGGFGPGARK